MEGSSGEATTTTTGPNNARHVVWALGEFFYFFFVFFIYLTIYIGTTKYSMVQHKQRRRQRAQGDLNHDNDSKHGNDGATTAPPPLPP